MGMIYGNTNHPVHIKKIKLKVWALREEIKSIVRSRISKVKDPKKFDVADLHDEYAFEATPSLTLLQGGGAEEVAPEAGVSEEISADAVADAMNANPEETVEEENKEAEGEEADSPEAEAGSGEETAEANAGEVVDGAEAQEAGEVQISQRRPDLEEDQYAEGVSLLSDINMMDICFFSNKAFIAGQTVIIHYQIPNQFSLTAEILSCKNYNISSRIISKTRPPFRVHARFIFAKKGEKTLLRNFMKSIEPDIPAEAPKPKVQEESNDFDDLDDLGL